MESTRRARSQFIRWRNDCLAHYSLQNGPSRDNGPGPRAIHVPLRRNRHQGSVADSSVPPAVTFDAPRGQWGYMAPFTPSPGIRADGAAPPRAQQQGNMQHATRNPPQGPNPPGGQLNPPRRLSRIPPDVLPGNTIDPEWLREVSQAFGPQGIQQLQQEQLHVMIEQRPIPQLGFNTPTNRPPQIVHAPHPPPPPPIQHITDAALYGRRQAHFVDSNSDDPFPSYENVMRGRPAPTPGPTRMAGT
jgi:hypothetical protein